jgi:2-oxoglutarate dehydrogenase E1 component
MSCSETFFEHLYSLWEEDPNSVQEDWQLFFSGFKFGITTIEEVCTFPLVEVDSLKIAAVISLISHYRLVGHLYACTDPLTICVLDHNLLNISNFGLDQTDLDSMFSIPSHFKFPISLREILSLLQKTYCRNIGVEFMHIQDPSSLTWLIDHMESSQNRPFISDDDRLHLLNKLYQATLFESFLQLRFPGQKRFSLEGGEILIPTLDEIIRNCAEFSINDIILGMAHRGRLNVLTHIFGKPYENIFAEFRDTMSVGFIGDGDVKYHKGYSADRMLSNGSVIHLTLASNPSHLEAVNSVVEGKCRARQDQSVNMNIRKVLPILIHGDSSFAGQGSIMESLNMSQLEGYSTGGTIHIVLNNQIGFTTKPSDSRSTLYATDVAKMLSCPIFHVQGESPEDALHVVRLAMAYRQEFGTDVVIELICYRRYGHNEGDEPSFTQPLMYRRINERPSINRIYANTLLESGISSTILDQIEHNVLNDLEKAFEKPSPEINVGFRAAWSSVTRDFSTNHINTSVTLENLLLLSRRLADLPPGFCPHTKVHALVQKRFESVLKNTGIDWGNAETLAYASLLDEGISVRLSGQDSRRGTFSHRHSVLHDMNDDRTYVPLNAVAKNGAVFNAWDSSLSEFGVLGFEYGYSLEAPNGLTIWEAQFGDFANGAQVIIDQFIASGETKWNRASGVVLMLPHGYEGQGAEHSSARVERFLQLCANNNLIIVNPSTPAQLFHVLRRQMLQSFRKPLILFTPKSLLRHPLCISQVEEFCSSTFLEVISDYQSSSIIRRVLFCSGKIYYDLIEKRDKQGIVDTVIVRIEQLYPLRLDLIENELLNYPDDCKFAWVQEEPENMGAWQYIRYDLSERCRSLVFVGRPADSCPAVSSHQLHVEQQHAIINSAFEL